MLDSASSHQHNLSNNGYTVVRRLHDQKDVSHILNLLESHYDPNKLFSGLPNRDVKDKRIYNLASKHIDFIRFSCEDKLLSLLKPGLQDPYFRWIDDIYCNFIIGTMSARSSGNFLDLHIDSGIPFRGTTPLGYVTIHAIEKTTIENGATFFIPKSHLSGTFTDRSRTDLTYAELNPGDVLIIDSRLWHGAGENLITSSRWTINTHFTQWFIKQDMDIPRTISQEIYEKCSLQEKVLLGFCSLPSPNETERINIKTGIESLKSSVSDFFKASP